MPVSWSATLAILLALWLPWSAGTTAGGFIPCGVARVSKIGRSESCLPGSDGLRVCVAPVDSESVEIVLRQNGRVTQRWKEFSVEGLLPRELRLVLADLTNDGTDDLVVATRNSSSNGMVIGRWTVCALDGSATASKPDCVPVDDFGFLGFFLRQPGMAGCFLLQTRWRWGTEPLRGDGLYLVGQWLRYTKAGFAPDESLPLVARRYLLSFENERFRHCDSKRPHLWFRDSRTRTVTCPDPLCE